MVTLEVPKSIGRKGGILEIVGGNSSYHGGEEFYFEEESYSATSRVRTSRRLSARFSPRCGTSPRTTTSSLRS